MSKLHEMQRRMLDAYYTHNAIYPVMSADGTRAIDEGIDLKRNVISGESNLTLTAALSGSLVIMDDATQAFVLPELTAEEVGIYFDFASTVAATTTTITAQAGDLLTGGIAGQSTTAGGADFFAPDVTDDLIITLNGTTTGGAIGTRIRLEAISATRWLVSGYTNGSGTLATPFS